MAGAALATCFGQPVTERAGLGTVWLANCPAAGTSPARPASAAGANTPAGGACPARPDPVTLADRPSRVHPVPGSDHRRSATVVVMLRGSQRRACLRGRCDGQPARGRDGSGWPCPRAGPRAAAAKAPGTGPPPGTPGSVAAEPARLSLIPGHAHPRSITNFEPATSSPQHDQNLATRLRETQGTSVWETGRSSSVCGGYGQVRQLSWMTRHPAAFEPPLAPPSVMWNRTRQPL